MSAWEEEKTRLLVGQEGPKTPHPGQRPLTQVSMKPPLPSWCLGCVCSTEAAGTPTTVGTSPSTPCSATGTRGEGRPPPILHFQPTHPPRTTDLGGDSQAAQPASFFTARAGMQKPNLSSASRYHQNRRPRLLAEHPCCFPHPPISPRTATGYSPWLRLQELPVLLSA